MTDASCEARLTAAVPARVTAPARLPSLARLRLFGQTGPRTDRGMALLEVLVALAILSASGFALVGLVSAGLRGERDARERERTLAAEDRVLTALTLLTREDLDRRLGRHPSGEFVADVERPERTLYRIALAQQESPQVEDLVTVVYRMESGSAP
jgi:prepilin-type N-terminal cleavage/methylation domain-containing protein